MLSLLRTMLRIRMFEDSLLKLFREGALRGTAHVCLGQEAVAAGACVALTSKDFVTSNHRGHGHLIAKGAAPRKIMAELFGNRDGYSRGRGGSQHMAASEVCFLGSNGITGGGIPIAVGAGLALKLRKQANVCLSFFGDGASPQGTFHESLNLAALWRLPVIFLCENNQYAMGTHVKATCPVNPLGKRAAGYGIPFQTVDGNDPLAVQAAVQAAREYALNGKGPSLVEALTWRAGGHSRSDQCEYRDKAEDEQWQARDPITLLKARILEEDASAQPGIDDLEQEVNAEITAATDFARNSPALPVANAQDLVFPEPKSPHPPRPEDNAAPARECTYAQALYLALAHALADDTVLLMGEDIADYHGAFRVTQDLFERFGRERVRNTPISENTVVGAGVGAAMCGMRPVVEIMFMDFLLLAMDQLCNHAAKFSYIFGGQYRVPLTLRTPAGGRRGYGATHSQCFESLLQSIPGLKIFNPATVQDAYDLLLEAIFDDAPVVFVEHKLLYGTKGKLDPSASPLPPGRARVVRRGQHLTIVTFSHMLGLCLAAAQSLATQGIMAEVIDLRTLAPLDLDTVVTSANQTQHVIVAEEGPLTGGVGAEIAARLQRECFGYLDAPILRVAASDCPVPTAAHLERQVLPQVEDIMAAAFEVLE